MVRESRGAGCGERSTGGSGGESAHACGVMGVAAANSCSECAFVHLQVVRRRAHDSVVGVSAAARGTCAWKQDWEPFDLAGSWLDHEQWCRHSRRMRRYLKRLYRGKKVPWHREGEPDPPAFVFCAGRVESVAFDCSLAAGESAWACLPDKIAEVTSDNDADAPPRAVSRATLQARARRICARLKGWKAAGGAVEQVLGFQEVQLHAIAELEALAADQPAPPAPPPPPVSATWARRACPEPYMARAYHTCS